MTAPSEHLAAARLRLPAGACLEVRGRDPVISTPFAAGEVAATALGLAGTAAARLHTLRTGANQSVAVDVTGAGMSLLGFVRMKASGGTDLARHHSPATGLYATRDERWIHLHGGFPALARGITNLLGCALEEKAIAAAVRAQDAFALEDAIASRGLCGAVVRSASEWAEHPQGRALTDLPAVEIERIGDAAPVPLAAGTRPLDGIRVLDLTRVLAGPTCGRTLASHGADVLRIGAERLPSIEPFVIDTGHGKRNAFVDLNDATGRTQLEGLIDETDLFCQSYRPGALAARDLSPSALASRRPGIIYVSLCCYGHVGPWADRAGWEQLAQSAVGIAAAGSRDGKPALIPAAATDYTTGYLAAFGAIAALERRATEGGSWHVKVSLSQTGMWLTRLGERYDPDGATGLDRPERFVTASDTAWGRLEHLGPIIEMDRTPPSWDRPPAPLGTHRAEWLA